MGCPDKLSNVLDLSLLQCRCHSYFKWDITCLSSHIVKILEHDHNAMYSSNKVRLPFDTNDSVLQWLL